MRTMRHPMWAVVTVGAFAVASACGGSSPSAPSTTGSSGSSGGPTVTITSAGVSPKEIAVAQGSRVLFVNNDSRPHFMASDPHPEHTDCPEVNQVGLLQPGQRRETGNLVTIRTCGYHDHDLPQTASLQGRIVIR